jgi:hypothetical protein
LANENSALDCPFGGSFSLNGHNDNLLLYPKYSAWNDKIASLLCTDPANVIEDK